MENEEIKTVSIEDFKTNEHIIDYVDDDFAIVNSLEGAPTGNDTVRLDCFLLAICVEGCIQLDINRKTYQLEDGDLLLGLPNTIISHIMLSPRNKIRLAGFSTRFLQRVLKMEKVTWNTAIYIHNNPIKHVGENKNEIFFYYRDLIVAKINDDPHHYHKEVIQHHFSVRCWELSTKKPSNWERSDMRKRGLNRLIIFSGNSLKSYRQTMACTVRYLILPMRSFTAPNICRKSSRKHVEGHLWN